MSPFAGYENFDSCVAQNQDKRDPAAYCGEIKHRTEDKALSKHFTPGSPHQHGQGAHTSMAQPRSGEEPKPPKPAHQKPFPRKKDVFGKLAKQHPDEYPENWGSDVPYQSLEEIEAQVEKLLKACPPGQHKHGGHDYCHDEGRKHRTHAGEAVHGIKYPKEKVTRPRAKRNPMVGIPTPQIRSQIAFLGPQHVARQLQPKVERLRGKVSHETFSLLQQGTKALFEGDEETGLQRIEQAHRRHAEEWKPYGGESKMRKAEKKRQDAEPTVTYDEPVEMIYEVGTRLKAVTKALRRQIKRQTESTAMRPSARQISGELRNIEKRVRNLPGCC